MPTGGEIRPTCTTSTISTPNHTGSKPSWVTTGKNTGIVSSTMVSSSMMVLTIPVFFPVVTQLGFDPVWFGVLIVLVVQVGLISPPVGMNMFVMNALLKDVPLLAIFRGSAIFCVPLVIGLILVLVFPQLALWLPGLMK